MRRLKRLILPAMLGLAIYFAVLGGEYTLFDLWGIRSRVEEEGAELERARRANDSLAARADSLEDDSATIERIARERFGMIRDGEILYRFAEPAEEGQEEGGVRR